MTVTANIIRPAGVRREATFVALACGIVLLIGAFLVDRRQVDESERRLFDWQISAFHDLKEADQAIYNALLTASEELWWIHGDMLMFADPDSVAAAWPTAEELDRDYAMPPFARDVAAQQHGNVQWQRAAAFTFEGSTVYFGSGGQAAGQSAYLLVLTHFHKGASYADGGTIWIHPDPDVAMPKTVKQDSLIKNGWKQVMPYSGAMEVERLKGS